MLGLDPACSRNNPYLVLYFLLSHKRKIKRYDPAGSDSRHVSVKLAICEPNTHPCSITVHIFKNAALQTVHLTRADSSHLANMPKNSAIRIMLHLRRLPHCANILFNTKRIIPYDNDDDGRPVSPTFKLIQFSLPCVCYDNQNPTQA